MTSSSIRCRMCRNILLTRNELLIFESQDCLPETQLFVDENEAPPWIKESIMDGQYIKGKINCPVCNGRIGAFDFVSHIPCRCGQHSLPHIRILTDRVDTIVSCNIITSVKNKTFMQRTDIGEERNSDSETAHIEESSLSLNSQPLEPQHHITHEDLSARNVEVTMPGTSTHSLELSEEGGANFSSNNVTSSTSTEENSPDTYSSAASERECNSYETEETPFSVNGQKKMKPNVLSKEEGVNKSTNSADEDCLTDSYTPEKDHLICPICLELFYLPQIVHPCLHIYCDPCLRQLNASSIHGQLIRCPMCRVKVKSCKPHKEYSSTIRNFFAEEHEFRKRTEKKVSRHRQHPLPGSSVPAGTRRGRARPGTANQQLSVLAGVCFVVMLIFLGFTIFAITIGFVSWYLLEVAMDLVVDLAVEMQTLCELLRSAIILFCIDGSLKDEYVQALFNSSTRLIMAFAKVVSTQENPENNQDENVKTLKDHMAERTDQILTKMTQAAIANYVVVGAIVTYALYRFARYLQQVRADG